MRSFLPLLVLCSAINALSFQSKSTTSETASATTQTGLPAITFSSVGSVSSIQMTGTANWTYGSDQQTGTVTLQANASGQSQLSIQVPNGTRVETQNAFSETQRQCTWSGADAVVHESAEHLCWLDTVWFLPQITMQTGTGAADDVVSLAQPSVANTVRLHHERRPVGVLDSRTARLLTHLSAVDLDIDAVNGLPLRLNYAAHPDSDGGTDIPVQVQFSDYRTVSGVTTPFHIQKFVNNSLVLDLQITDVQVQLAAPTTTSTSSSTLQ